MSVLELDTPALLIDVDQVERNIHRMATKAKEAGVALRPHFKTSKLLEIARMQIAAGAIGMTCATDREVEALRRDGVESILWGHQAIGGSKVALAVETNRHGELIATVDDVDGAVQVGKHAAEAGLTVPCAIEVDTGLERCGVLPADVLPLARALRDVRGIRLVGLVTHEGHMFRYLDDTEGLVAAAGRAASSLVEAQATCADAGIDMSIVSVGSTPAAVTAPFEEGITEVRPGTYVFFDGNQVELGAATWEDCAVTVLARVVSHNRSGLPVIDAGLKELSGDGSIRGVGHGYVPGVGARLMSTFEEHAVLMGGRSLNKGDLVQIVPNHACGAVNMWSQVYATRDGAVVDQWYTAGRR